MIPLKSEAELELMRHSGAILAKILRELRGYVKAGIRTADIDELAERLTQRENARPAFKGYKGFPSSVCTSVNDEIVHGIPGQRVLEEGDILSLDFGIEYEGFFTDAAITVPIGRFDSRTKKLVSVTKAALTEGIKQARAGNYLSDISFAIQGYVERYGFSVVRQFVGHGIGRALHEEPEIPNFGKPHHGPVLQKGMVFAIEPMVNMGSWECDIVENGWTAVTRDGSYSAHFEHTVAITEKGPLILT
jgi:methionyl aminopeptidase